MPLLFPPTQELPPCAGAGLSHVLLFHFIPPEPQDTEHAAYSDHVLHFPSTIEIKSLKSYKGE